MLKKIDIKKIKRNPKNPRYLFDSDALTDLANTIKKQGVIHPIEVDENNMIICGERRWRASKMAKIKEIPCIVKTGLSEFEKLQRQYIENAQHRDLNIIEKGKAFKSMLKYRKEELLANRDNKHKSEYHSKGIKELADNLGEKSWLIREAVLLAGEEKAITKAIEEEKIPYSQVIKANKLDDEKLLKKVKNKILNNEFPSRATLDETINILKENPDIADILLAKSGDELKEEIERINDASLIAKQDLKKTVLAQAFPFIEDEYKTFHSTNLARFIEHLRDLVKN